MIKFSINIPIEEEKNWKNLVYKKLNSRQVSDLTLIKKSIDARDKGKIFFVYQVAAEVKNEDIYINEGYVKYEQPITKLATLLGDNKYLGARPVVVGTGPCGLFAALSLAIMGAKPIIIERGGAIEDRINAVKNFVATKNLDTNTNVQFGEGGAGTFSDGKLYTGINSPYIPVVLGEFVKFGASEDIFYDSKPHIGTDKLVNVVQNMRKKIIEYGGEFFYNTKLIDLKISNNKVSGVVTESGTINTDRVYLAMGHSARDTYEMLYAKGILMESKTYSMGVRIEHLQQDINNAQHGRAAKILPAADYKLASHLDNGRSLYSFCMCPGGYVVNASSEEKGITVNGMSEYLRDGKNANSALLVNVGMKEWKSEHPLAGIEYQRTYERKAYNMSNSYLPPVQLYGDLVKNKVSDKLGEVIPSVNTGYIFGDLRACLPSFITESIVKGVKNMAAKLKYYDLNDTVLTGIEARSSSPVKILRDDKYCSSLVGLYPLGEGAGYAGGIMSASVDGIKGVLASMAE